MKLIAAGLGDDGDGRATRHTLFGIEIVGRDVNFLHGFRRRNVYGVVRQPDEHIRGAVHSGIIVVPVGSVDVRAQATFRRVGDRILKSPRSGAGHQIDQGLKVAVLVEGQIQNGFFCNLGVNVALFGLQGVGRGLHRDLFGDRAHLQFRIGVVDGVGGDHQIGLGKGLEPAGCDLQVVVARRKIGNQVMATFVSVRFTLNAGGAVGKSHMSLRHTRAAGIHHRACYRPIKNLSARGRREQDGLNTQNSKGN